MTDEKRNPYEQDSYTRWANIPVAVQLKVPYAVVVAAEDERRQPIRLKGGAAVYGQPALLEGTSPKGDKQVVLHQVLFGSLEKGQTQRLVILRSAIPGGGVVEILIDVADIQYISAITKVPEPVEPSRIVAPS